LPLVHFRHGDDFCQVHARQAREAACQFQCLLHGRLVALHAGHDGAGLGALLAQHAGQLAGVDTGDGDDVLGLQVVGQRLAGAEIRMDQRQVADDQACGVDFGSFDVFGVDTVVADMRVSQGDDLAGIRWIGQDFLITRHGGIENDFARRVTGSANGNTFKDCSVG
jgi:hypothetical protein